MALRPLRAAPRRLEAVRLELSGILTARRLGVCILVLMLPLSAVASEITLVKRASRVAPLAKTAKPKAAPVKKPQTYTINAGDSLSGILVAKLNPRREDMARLMAEVKRLNPHIADINNIPVGRAIVLPQYKTAKLRPGPAKPPGPKPLKPARAAVPPVAAAPAAARPVPTKPAPQAVQEVVVVQRGQCLGLILRERYGLPDEVVFGEFLHSIRVANPGIQNLDCIQPGQQIVIPKIPEEFFAARRPLVTPIQSASQAQPQPAASAEVRFVEVPKGAVIVKQSPAARPTEAKAAVPAVPASGAPALPAVQAGSHKIETAVAPARATEASVASRSLVKALSHMGLDARSQGTYYAPTAAGGSLAVDLSQVPLLDLPGSRKVFLDVDKRLTPTLRRAIQAVLPGSVFVDAGADLDATMGAVLRQAGYYSVNRNTPLFVGAEEKLRFVGNYVVYKDSSRRAVCLVNLLGASVERTPELITAYARRFGIEIVEIGGQPPAEVAAGMPGPLSLDHSYPALLKALGKTCVQGEKLQLVNEDPVKLSYSAPLKCGRVILCDRLPDETIQNLLRLRGYNLIATPGSGPAEVLGALGVDFVAAPFKYSLPNARTVIECDALRLGNTLVLLHPIDEGIARYLAARGFKLLVW